MDKFEKLIKDSLEGHEAPFDPQAWENVSNELGDSFDQMMKESTNGYEAPFNPAAWDAVNHQLGPAYSAWKWIGGSAAVIALVAGGSYLMNNSESDDNQLTNHEGNEVVINNTDNNNVEDTYFVGEENSDEIASNDNNDVVVIENNGNEEVLHEIDPDLNNGVQNDNDANDNDQWIDLGDPLDNETVVNSNNGDQDVNNHNDNGNNNSNNNNTDEHVNDFKANAKFSIIKDNEYITDICQNESCIFKPEQMEKDLIYVWNFGDGSHSAANIGKHKYTRAGEYNITLEVKDPRTNKTVGTSTESIVVNKLPKVNFEWEQSNELIPTVSFINLTDEATDWNWNIKGLKESNKNEFEYTFRKAGNYAVQLTARNDNGCSNSLTKTIDIKEDYNLLAPTAFSPDGDGQFDNFIPLALTVMNVDFTMTIYDKNGKLVYRTQNAYEPWDGRYTEDNKLAENGSSYIWSVVLTNNNGEKENYKGQVFVIR